MRKSRELLTKLTRRLDIPREALPLGFGLSLSGREVLNVRGSCRILTCGRERIRLSLGKAILCIAGEELICTAFEEGALTVEGRISALSFEEGHRAD